MRAFIFDMDGCLLDSIRFWHEAEQHIMDTAGIELSKDERDELNALTLEEAGAFFHDRFGILDDSEAVVRAIIDYMIESYRTRVNAKPGVVDFIRTLRGAQAKLCVLSSSPQSFMQAGLGRTGLLEYFDPAFVLSVEELGMVKRDTSTYAHVCDLLGSDAAQTWMFDDSWYAVATAREAGLRTVGVFSSDGCGTHEELARYCDIVVDDFTGLDALDMLG